MRHLPCDWWRAAAEGHSPLPVERPTHSSQLANRQRKYAILHIY